MTAVLWIWGITLGMVTLIIVPLAIVLLQRTLRAASAIERYTREALDAGLGIARNTEAVTALEETIAAAGSLLEASQKLAGRTDVIAKAVGTKRG
ncbi:MAG TPA: hypothetical protein VEK15_31210 [Vicinamibacteria bacterium]|nr:hypothetical protein [Vicinamibacteria bacterium]